MARRVCFGCGEPISACMGFVKSGDLLEMVKGLRTEHPRELCGKCVFRYEWNEAGELIPNSQIEIMRGLCL